MTAFMPAGCERLLPSVILALVIELGLQGISGAVSPIDMIPAMHAWLELSGHPPSQCFLLLDSGFAP